MEAASGAVGQANQIRGAKWPRFRGDGDDDDDDDGDDGGDDGGDDDRGWRPWRWRWPSASCRHSPPQWRQ